MSEEFIRNPKGRVLVLGLGGEGVRILDALRRNPAAQWISTLAVDTDGSMLKECEADEKINASSDWSLRSNAGCGGDIIRGERAIARERANLMQRLKEFQLVIVAGGLGGGTATGGVRTIASVARACNVPAIFVLTTPFSFEAYARRKNSDTCLSEILPMADLVITLPNDLLFSTLPPRAPVETAFALAAKEMAATISGIASVLRSRDLIGTDFGSFMQALREKRADCGVGVGVAGSSDGLDRCALALERMLESPFLGGMESIRKANAAIVTVTGGKDLELAEVKRALELAANVLPKDMRLVLGANTCEEATGSVQITAVVIRYEQIALEAVVGSARNRRASQAETRAASLHARDAEQEQEQGLLALPSYSRGYFEKFAITKFHDEDLDVPTFQRRNITVDKGIG